MPIGKQVSTNWYQGPVDLNMRSPGAGLFAHYCLPPSPDLFRDLGFGPLRRLALGIWDGEKMARLGLFSVPDFLPLEVSRQYLVGPHEK